MSLVTPGTAAAATLTKPPPASSAIAQYVEILPTASGGSAVGTGSGRGQTLPRAISRAIGRAHGSEATLLRDVATSPRYGAPTVSKTKRQTHTTPRQSSSQSRPHTPGALSAVVSATGVASARDIGILIAALAFSTILIGVVALSRRRHGASV